MTKNIIISHPKKLEEFKKSISKTGHRKLHILSDFDRTLTTAFVNGKSRPSIVSVLRDGNYLSPDYAKKAHALYAKYHPIEIDPKISLEEKKKAMHEWWATHFDLRIKSGLNKKHLEEIVESGKVKFRQGTLGFIDFLHVRNIPLVIMSSSSIGGDVIAMYFAKEGKLYNNVYIISNLHKWDENGNAIGYKKPIIHIMNKDEVAIRNFSVFNIIKSRKNVILLGDSLGDVGMITGFKYDNLIKIGFLDENVEENLEEYKRNFDILILNDSSMYYVNKLLREIC